jgi:hypothetical protein
MAKSSSQFGPFQIVALRIADFESRPTTSAIGSNPHAQVRFSRIDPAVTFCETTP